MIVLDRDLPVVHGDQVCRIPFAGGAARIPMLTAAAAVDDRVDGLELGADDYLGKPFAFHELIARVHWAGGHRRRRRSCAAATSPWTGPLLAAAAPSRCR